jgi:hypothetical protein
MNLGGGVLPSPCSPNFLKIFESQVCYKIGTNNSFSFGESTVERGVLALCR